MAIVLATSCVQPQEQLNSIRQEVSAIDNPAITSMLQNAENFDVDGVGQDLNRLVEGPARQAECGPGVDSPDVPNTPSENVAKPFQQINGSTSGKNTSLWATNYYTPIYDQDAAGVVLKRKSEKTILYKGSAVRLTEKKWCLAAMEGSVSIKFPDGETKTFNYEGTGTMQASCAKYFAGRFASTGRVKFKQADSKWGHGVKNYSLVPYRTIAVDPKKIPYGSVVFIPEAKGKEITLENGDTFIHDGYFFAGDTGGAIKKNHIDVFTGNSKNHSFNFIGNNSSKTFNAKIIKDESVIKEMTEMHLKKY